MYPANFDPAKKYPLVVSVHGGPSAANFPSWPSRWNAVLPTQRLLRAAAEPARQLRRRRSVHAGQHQRLRLRRSARHRGRRRRRGEGRADRSQPHRHHRLELRRLHDDVGGDADDEVSRRRWRAPASRTGRATTARTRSTPGCCRSSARRSTTSRRRTRARRRSRSSRKRRRRRWCCTAIATPRCRRRRATSSGTRSRRSTCRPSW